MNELTRDWLDTFAESKARGERLEKSIFWRLAADVLPEGVDAEDPGVKVAVEEIRAAMNRAEGKR